MTLDLYLEKVPNKLNLGPKGIPRSERKLRKPQSNLHFVMEVPVKKVQDRDQEKKYGVLWQPPCQE